MVALITELSSNYLRADHEPTTLSSRTKENLQVICSKENGNGMVIWSVQLLLHEGLWPHVLHQ